MRPTRLEPARRLGLVLGAGLFATASVAVAASAPVPAKRVILISIDTLRPDHLGTYGYPRPTSPALDALARRGVVFEKAMAQAPYTLPSHMSLLTGLEVWAHGVRLGNTKLRDEYTTLAETLKTKGFATAAWTDGGFMSARYGFDQGFDVYHDQRAPGSSMTNGFRRYGEDVRRWVEAQGEDPFFLFLHTFDTHGPYQAEEEHFEALAGSEPVVPAGAGRLGDPLAYLRKLGVHDYLELDRFETLGDMIGAYDATIRFVDSEVGRLVDWLEERELLDDALVVITSDHGESFMDHHLYVGHGLTLYDEEIHVPLIVKFPGDRYAGTRCSDVVRSIDVFPTVTVATGAETSALIQGVDLVRALEGLDVEPRIASGVSPNLAAHRTDGVEGVTGYIRRLNQKLVEPPACGLGRVLASHLDREAIRDRGEEYDLDADPLRIKERLSTELQLYDLSADPQEQNNLAAVRSRDVKRIERRMKKERERNVSLARVLGVGAAPEVLFQSEQQLEELFSQGYLSSDQLRRLKAEFAMRRKKEAEQAEKSGEGDG